MAIELKEVELESVTAVGRDGEDCDISKLPQDMKELIYQYIQDSWRIKSQFARERVSNILCREMVECNGIIFWTGMFPTTIVGYNIREEGFINPVTVAPLPPQMAGPDVHILSMVSYGKSVLVLDRIISVIIPMFVGMVIWELFEDEEDELVWKWKKFASVSLPQHLMKGHQSCVCVGDYLCFLSEWGAESATLFAYNLKEGFWQHFPPCNSDYLERMMMSFEPKLHNYPI
ncbi:hypothetical protein SUGI_0249200 [Cryptomeria japonica]|nr:hypothetical protein SUGI_0249200 [Cryptomeria japonica]